MFNKYNYFTTENNQGQYGCIKSIVSFMEDVDSNFIMLLGNKDYYKSPFRGGDVYHKEFSHFDQFKSIIEDKSNFFRINSVVLDFTGMEITKILKYMKEVKKIDTEYRYFIMCDDVKGMILDDQTIVYDVKTSSVGNILQGDYKSDYILTSCSTNSSFELANFFKQYRRDIVIDKLMNR